MEQTYSDYLKLLKSSIKGLKWSEYGNIKGNPLVVLTSPLKKKNLFITSGFHGDEPVGPITFLRHGQTIIDMAEHFGIGLRICPCTNPTGWATGHRYNTLGERPSNHFMEYFIDGDWKGSIEPGEKYEEIRLKNGMPKDTRALAEDISLLDAPTAILDIHQDGEQKEACTYAYVFGDRAPYRKLAKAASTFAPLLKNTKVDDSPRDSGKSLSTDEFGLMESHDGSIQDYFHRRGTKYSATLETSLKLPSKTCMAVNLVWMMGFVSLAAMSES